MPDPDPTPDPTPDPAPDPTPDPAPEPDPKPAGDPLGDGGKAALAAERKLRRDAEKAAKDAQDRLDAIEAENLTEAQKEKKRADDAELALADAQGKMQQAFLVAELAKPDLGLASATAAAKLIEGVEYDENGKPTNLGDPSDGESLIGKFLAANPFLRTGDPAKPQAPSIDGGAGGGGKPPQLTADELRVAQQSGMTPEEYVAFRDGDSLADLEKAGAFGSK